MSKFVVGYRTGTDHDLSLDIFGELYMREDISLFYPKDDLYLLCGKCGGFSGGCPPYAPYFDQLKPTCPWFYVIVVRMDVAWGIKYSGHSEYLRFSYVDRLTEFYMKRIMNELSKRLKAFGLICGGCRGCNNHKEKCPVIRGGKCSNPRRRTYSVEAVGVDCSELHEMIFGRRLPYWYYDGALPRYMVRYGGLFLRDDVASNVDGVIADVIRNDKSYIPFVPAVPQYRLVKRVAPAHVLDAGLEYDAYVLNKDGEYDME